MLSFAWISCSFDFLNIIFYSVGVGGSWEDVPLRRSSYAMAQLWRSENSFQDAPPMVYGGCGLPGKRVLVPTQHLEVLALFH